MTQPELGHLKRFGVGPHRTIVEFRGGLDGAFEGETVTVEVFEPGDEVKVAGIGIGKGFQGTIKRHNFSSGPRGHGSHNVRAPGSVGASATPSRVFKGVKIAGPDGRQARHPARAHHPQHRRGAEPAARQGLGPGPEERARRGAGLMAAPKAPVLAAKGGAGKDVSLEEAVFGVEVKPHLVHEAVRAEQNAHRAGTMASKSRGLVSGGRSKPWRQKGTGRARAGTTRAAQFTGGGHVFAKVPRSFDLKVNRKAAKAALRSALASHAAGELARAARRDVVRRAVDQARQGRSRGRRARRPRSLVVLTDDEQAAAKSFRNLPKVAVVAPSEVEVGAVVWARTLLVSEAALPLLADEGQLDARTSDRPRARRSPRRATTARSTGKYTFKVHEDAHKTQIRQAVEELFEVHVVSVNVLKVQAKPKRRGAIKGTRQGWKKAIVQLQAGETIEVFQGAQI